MPSRSGQQGTWRELLVVELAGPGEGNRGYSHRGVLHMHPQHNTSKYAAGEPWLHESSSVTLRNKLEQDSFAS